MQKTITAKNSIKKEHLKRYELDSSAKFYPVIASKKSQSLFCVGAVLADDIEPQILKKALNEVIRRYPILAVTIERGYGWHYLQENRAEVPVFPAEERILRPIDTKLTNGYMFRVSYIATRIRIDMFHGLCDGTACVHFLESLVLRYQQLRGVITQDIENILQVKDDPTDAEIEDSYLKYYKPMSLFNMDIKTLKGGTPLRLTGEPIGETGYFNIEGTASLNEIKERAKEKGVTVTAYISGILAMTIEEISKEKRPIVMMIPVNLRKIFPSQTLRNFVTFVRIEIKPGKFKTLDEICNECAIQLKEKTTKENLHHFICTTVRVQNNGILACIPLAIKSFFINTGRAALKSRQTIIYSNVGLMKMPEKLGIKKFTINMNVSRFNPQNMGSITVGDKISFNFTRAIKGNVLPDTFFRNLEQLGIHVEKEYEGINDEKIDIK
ncbi:MAG: hypothetical protein RSB59_02240 [Clostridia bacterium]